MVVFQSWAQKEERGKEKIRSDKAKFILNQVFKKILKLVFSSIRKMQDYFRTTKEADKYVRIKLNLEKVKLNTNELNYVISSLQKTK